MFSLSLFHRRSLLVAGFLCVAFVRCMRTFHSMLVLWACARHERPVCCRMSLRATATRVPFMIFSPFWLKMYNNLTGRGLVLVSMQGLLCSGRGIGCLRPCVGACAWLRPQPFRTGCRRAHCDDLAQQSELPRRMMSRMKKSAHRHYRAAQA